MAETEATFTLLVSASLLVWHAGIGSGWSPTLTWSLGYGLAALAGLAKGPQGPVYFVAPIVIYLLVSRQGRMLWTRAHLAGMATFIFVLGMWQVPYFLATDWASTRGIWLNNAAERFRDPSMSVLLRHMLSYPLEVLVCMLPWSAWLILFLRRDFRQSLGAATPHALFLGVCLAVTFPSVWLASGAKGRYFMPLYPAVAVLAGLAIDRVLASDALPQWRRHWRPIRDDLGPGRGRLRSRRQRSRPDRRQDVHADRTAWAVCGDLLPGRIGDRLRVAAAPRGVHRQQTAKIAVVSLAAFLGLTFTGAVINTRAKIAEDTAALVAEAKAELPNGQRLVSLGYIDHLFAYHYRDPHRLAAGRCPCCPTDAVLLFRYETTHGRRHLPAWDKVAEIPLARNKEAESTRAVVIGRVRTETAANLIRTRQTRQHEQSLTAAPNTTCS